MKSRISSARQALARGPSLMGRGAIPCWTHEYHVARLTGIGPVPGGLPMILLRRTKPVAGMVLQSIGVTYV